ncbi:MAG: DEAD/DEAH box helicase, partial [Planctomycetales bacterium]|nr:DEAD/DEAH box helicase [Planctomycetales bacterium]
VADMPVERLKEATRDRISTAPLKEAGIKTVLDVINAGSLQHLPGIGPTLATRIKGAAQTLWQTTYDEMPARIDIKRRTPQATELLRRLRVWDGVRRSIGGTDDLNLAEELGPLSAAVTSSVTNAVAFCAPGATAAGLLESIERLRQRARRLSDAGQIGDSGDPWDDFLTRPADYFALLSELGFITEDDEKTHGDLPDDIIEAVRALELKTEYLSASLRGYQSFGARFGLVQRKVVIGDEMGLGKTVEAIAVLSHLRAIGSHHALVICPAAVVTNWVREVSSKSKLAAHRLHGPDRGAAAEYWRRKGGVAVTTFDSLNWLHQNVSGLGELACVVIDEAHYIKNPDAIRTRNSRRLLDSCDRAILLTGTPLENRIEEFRNLVGYLRPDLVVDATEIAPRRFRRQVAPAYLRRNQEDVLTELPELVEVEEWLPLTGADAAAYRDAVSAGNFMAMRQAAMVGGDKSAKVARLVEIVEEAEDNGRRVVVFSYFRDVLDQVAAALPGRVFGPLTGSVAPIKRQEMVDQFSNAGHGAVLVAQIVAGGVGL